MLANNESTSAWQRRPSPSVLRMKNPIMGRGQIRKQNSRFHHGLIGSHTNTDSQKTHSAFSYIKAATKRVGVFFTALLFARRKVKSKTDQPVAKPRRGATSLNSVDNSSRSSGKSSSRNHYSSSYASSRATSTQIGSLETSFDEICMATGNFSSANKIGEGGFGTVYWGKLKDESIVAIKRAKKGNYDQDFSQEFKNEIITLSKLEHQNLVRFLGYLEHGDERIIIEEYVSNGTLREHLDGLRGDGLETAKRLDIAIDVAHAITYLHTYTDPPIIHRDIKTSNILITERLRAKVADFGFARLAAEDPGATHISTQIKGTAGYLDPEYLNTFQLTEKSDVYSFGVLLVEMMTGRHPLEPRRGRHERVTIRWALKRLKDGEAVVAMDPRLRRNPASNQAVEEVLKLAEQCVAPSRHSRPFMKKCAEILWQIRKDLRDNNLAHAAAPSNYHSENMIEIGRRRIDNQDLCGIADSDYYRFHSA